MAKAVDQAFRIVIGEEHLAVHGKNESILTGAVGLTEKRIVITLDIEQRAGLAQDSELRPGEDFAEFIPGAEAARQREKRVGAVGHEGLAFVHRTDDMHFCEAGVRDFFGRQSLRNHTDDLAARRKAGVGENAHQADVSATINQRDAALCQLFANDFCRSRVSRPPPRARSAKNTQSLDHS